MAAPTVIKWTDPGAPMLSRVAGSFIAILEYCLLQRGWEKVWHVGNRAVFRASAGNRKFFRVLNDDSFYYSSTSYLYCSAKITAYDSMTDVDTGAGQWAEQYVSLSWSGTPVSRPWICVFDEKSVYIHIIPDRTTGLTMNSSFGIMHGFGDTIPALPGQTSRSFLSGDGSVSHSPLINYSLCGCMGSYSLWNGVKINRSLDGTRTAVQSGLTSTGTGSNGSNEPPGNFVRCLLPYPYNGELLVVRPYLDDGIQYSAWADFLPGVYHTLQAGSGFNNWGVYSSGDKSFLALYVVGYERSTGTTNNNEKGVVLLDISEGFAQ